MENAKIYEALIKIGDELTQELISELSTQGHTLTGALEKSIQSKITEMANNITLSGSFNFYGRFMETGVPKERIPFYPGSGNKTSKYITALINYSKLRFGLDAKAAKGRAFQIAYKQKFNTGMPTRGANFTKFLSNTLQNKHDDITKQLNEAGAENVRKLLSNMITKTQELL